VVDGGSDDAWEAALREPEALLRGPGSPTFTSRLAAWVADARVDEAARARSRERWLQVVAEQEATFIGILLDLAERGAAVVLSAGGRRLHGVISGLGADFVALRPGAGGEVLVALGAITQARTSGAADATVGDRMVTSELRLVDVLAQLAADRERVRIVTSDGEVAAGRLRNVGQDVVVLRVDGDPPATCYLPSSGVAEVSLG
jgi:hypothetical protein